MTTEPTLEQLASDNRLLGIWHALLAHRTPYGFLKAPAVAKAEAYRLGIIDDQGNLTDVGIRMWCKQHS